MRQVVATSFLRRGDWSSGRFPLSQGHKWDRQQTFHLPWLQSRLSFCYTTLLNVRRLVAMLFDNWELKDYLWFKNRFLSNLICNPASPPHAEILTVLWLLSCVFDILDLRVKQFLFALVCWTVEYPSWDRGGRAVVYLGEGLRGFGASGAINRSARSLVLHRSAYGVTRRSPRFVFICGFLSASRS